MSKLQSPSTGSSQGSAEDMYSFAYSFVNSVGHFSPICQGLPVQVLCGFWGTGLGQDRDPKRQRSGWGPWRPLPLPDMSSNLLSCGLSLPSKHQGVARVGP